MNPFVCIYCCYALKVNIRVSKPLNTKSTSSWSWWSLRSRSYPNNEPTDDPHGCNDSENQCPF